MTPYNTMSILGKIDGRVYQRTAPGHGNVAGDPLRILQNRAYVPHNPSHTPAQQARRALFAAGVTAWHTTDAGTKERYRWAAGARGLTGFNLWMSDWLTTI